MPKIQPNRVFYKKLFLIGAPFALSHMLENGAWSYLYHIIPSYGKGVFDLFVIGVNLTILYSLMSDSMKRSVTILSSKVIGGGHVNKISQLTKSMLSMHILIWVVLIVPSIIMINNFHYVFQYDELMFADVFFVSQFVLFYFLFDGCFRIILRVLISVGQHPAVLLANGFFAWMVVCWPLKYFCMIMYSLRFYYMAAYGSLLGYQSYFYSVHVL